MIDGLVISYTLVLARVGSFVALLPVFGGAQLPKLVKMGLAVSLATLWFGSVDAAALEFLHASPQAQWWLFGIALAKEAVLGALLGYGFGLFLVPLRVAGEFISEEMGLSMANQVDPLMAGSTSVLAQAFEMLGTMMFFGLNGHHVFLAVLNSTFSRWPVGGSLVPIPIAHIVDGTASVEQWGLMIAAPLGICLFLASIVMALMARAAPHMNIWSVGFGVRLIVGLLAGIILLPHLGKVMIGVFGNMSEWLLHLV